MNVKILFLFAIFTSFVRANEPILDSLDSCSGKFDIDFGTYVFQQSIQDEFNS